MKMKWKVVSPYTGIEEDAPANNAGSGNVAMPPDAVKKKKRHTLIDRMEKLMVALRHIVNTVRNLRMLDKNEVKTGLVNLLKTSKRKRLKWLMVKDIILLNLWQICPIEMNQKRKRNSLVV